MMMHEIMIVAYVIITRSSSQPCFKYVVHKNMSCVNGLNDHDFCSKDDMRPECEKTVVKFVLTDQSPLEEKFQYRLNETRGIHNFQIGNYRLTTGDWSSPKLIITRPYNMLVRVYAGAVSSADNLTAQGKCVSRVDGGEGWIVVTFDRLVCQYQKGEVVNFVDETCLRDVGKNILFEENPGWRLPWHRFKHVTWNCLPNINILHFPTCQVRRVSGSVQVT